MLSKTTLCQSLDNEEVVEISPTVSASSSSSPSSIPLSPRPLSANIKPQVIVLGTEDTPLTQEGRRRKSSSRRSRVRSTRRRPTAVESLIHAMVKRAFSISAGDEGEQNNAEYDNVDADEFYEDEIDDSYDNRNKNTQPSSCLRCNAIICMVVGVVLGVAIAASIMISPLGNELLSQMLTSSPSSTSCAADNTSVMSLKDSASLEGLKHGAVASDHPLCSQIGSDILRQGGNAVDAAVATVLCLGVANPASSGLGGGAFLLIHSSRSHFESKDTTKFPVFVDARDEKWNDQEQGSFITEVVDCRETAPEKSSTDMYNGLSDTASAIGPLAIAVPGELRGLELAHARHGQLSWRDVVEPARQLAHDGFAVGKHLALDIKGVVTQYMPKYGEYPALLKHLSRDGTAEAYLIEGEIFKNPGLARLLKQIQAHGADALYKGENARSIVQDVQDAGGILTVRDMEDYKATLRTPLHADVSGYTVVGVPPPSSGGAVLIGAARFLAGYKTPLAAAADTLSIHRIVEAMRHAFSIRMSLSDPLYNVNVTKDAVHDLIQGDYMESLRRWTKDNETLGLSHYGGKKWAQMNDDDSSKLGQDAHEGDRRDRSLRQRRLARPFGYLDDSGTSHLSVVDKSGNAVAVTSSVNGIFGSWIFSESTGVILGNTMDDFGVPGRSNFFGLKPSESNFVVPGKKPLSSMSPTMVFRQQEERFASETNGWGDLVLTLGGSGGPKIITAVLQVLLNVCFLGMPLFESMARPRVHDQLIYHDAVVTGTERDVLEEGPTIAVGQQTKDALLLRGHKLVDIDYTGCVQAIAVDRDTNTLAAVSDIRKGGSPSGY